MGKVVLFADRSGEMLSGMVVGHTVFAWVLAFGGFEIV